MVGKIEVAFYVIIFLIMGTIATFLYLAYYDSYNNRPPIDSMNIYARLYEYESYNVTTGQINETKYLLEDASPDVLEAARNLYNTAFLESTVIFLLAGDLNNTQMQKITDASAEFYGLIVKEDPEVFNNVVQQYIQGKKGLPFVLEGK